MMIDFETDASALTINDDEIKGIAELGKRAKVLQTEVEDLEAVIKERKDQFRKLTEQTIPEALAETGMRAFMMEDGSR
jgi:uncharacterized small protein (DUF1192 family)